MSTLDKHDLAQLKRAKDLLENPGLAVKFSAVLGSPVEAGMKMLPNKLQKAVHAATEAALMKALDVAVRTLGAHKPRASSDRLHKLGAATSGAIGGAFGIAALGIELPVSTTLILRSIADIAAAEGEDPRHLDTKLACLTVFALGSTRDKSDDAGESAYFASRSALATAVTEASRYLAEKGLSKSGAPALLRLVALIASRFGIVVSQKTAAQMIPVIGAAGGAMINTLFIGHYQDMARGHFIVRRLEKIHGAQPVKLAYESL